MDNNMEDYRLRYYEDRIRILIIGIISMPNCLNTSRIHCGVSRYGKIVQMTEHETRFLMVNYDKNGLVG